MVEAFPRLADVVEGDLTPADLRKDSLLGSTTIIRVLAGVFHVLAVDFVDDVPELDEAGAAKALEFFKQLSDNMDAPVMPGTPWHDTGFFPDGAMAPSSRSQDLKGLTNLLVIWAMGIAPMWTAPQQ